MADYSTTVREAIEWIGIRWHDEAETVGLKRVLLVGDSIVAAHGTELRTVLKGDFGVDYFATSKIVSDHEYMPDLDFMMSRYRYAMIIFNNGLHGAKVDDAVYGQALAAVLAALKPRTSHLVWRSSTPCYAGIGRADRPWVERGPVRNRLAAACATALGIPILDLYALMENRPELSADGAHFKPEGYAIVVEAEAAYIRKVFA